MFTGIPLDERVGCADRRARRGPATPTESAAAMRGTRRWATPVACAGSRSGRRRTGRSPQRARVHCSHDVAVLHDETHRAQVAMSAAGSASTAMRSASAPTRRWPRSSRPSAAALPAVAAPGGLPGGHAGGDGQRQFACGGVRSEARAGVGAQGQGHAGAPGTWQRCAGVLHPAPQLFAVHRHRGHRRSAQAGCRRSRPKTVGTIRRAAAGTGAPRWHRSAGAVLDGARARLQCEVDRGGTVCMHAPPAARPGWRRRPRAPRPLEHVRRRSARRQPGPEPTRSA